MKRKIKYDDVNAGQVHANISGCSQLFVQKKNTGAALNVFFFPAYGLDCFKSGGK